MVDESSAFMNEAVNLLFVLKLTAAISVAGSQKSESRKSKVESAVCSFH